MPGYFFADRSPGQLQPPGCKKKAPEYVRGLCNAVIYMFDITDRLRGHTIKGKYHRYNHMHHLNKIAYTASQSLANTKNP
jgi:hypothetical protein